MIKLILFNLMLLICKDSFAQSGIPSKIDFDNLMGRTVIQLNEQMAGSKIDEGTTLKFVTYDKSLPLFTYFYTATTLADLNIKNLSNVQIDTMKRNYVQKACASTGRFMKPYNLKVAHVVEDKKTGQIFFKITVSHADC